MRFAAPLLTAVLLCSASGIFGWGEDAAAQIIGTPDFPATTAVLRLVALILQPWIILLLSFVGSSLVFLIASEAVSAAIFFFVLIGLRRWRVVYYIITGVAIAVSPLLIYYGVRDHRAAVEANENHIGG